MISFQEVCCKDAAATPWISLTRVLLAYSAALDIILAILPWPLIWTLQMTKREKFGVALAMSMGFMCVVSKACAVGTRERLLTCLLSAGIVTIVKTVQIAKLFAQDMCQSTQPPPPIRGKSH